MVLNRYEYSKIPNSILPESWKSQASLDELAEFLQQNWEQRAVFYDDEEIKSQQQFIEFIGSGGIRTKKYIGTIVFRGEQLNIYPRVFSTEKEDHETCELTQRHLQKNLLRWMEYCNKLDYPFINITSELQDSENLKELFVTLYVGYVRSALERGPYYQYVDETADRANIQGRFDFNDYILRKVPNGQIVRFNCTYSKFEFDNKINRIIKYTCKLLFRMTSRKNQKTIQTILSRLPDVEEVTCTPRDCDQIRLSRLHRNFEIIISMSKMFLLNMVSNYSINTNESFCFLFPTYLLFEGFIGGFLKEVVEESGGIVKLQESRMSLVDKIIFKGVTTGAAFSMRHDILAEINGKVFVLDTKYKEMSRFENNPDYKDTIINETKQSDLYQVLEYARKRYINDVYLLYPMYRFEEREDEFPIAVSESPSGNINVHFIRMPFVFEENIEHTKQQLKVVIKTIFSL